VSSAEHEAWPILSNKEQELIMMNNTIRAATGGWRIANIIGICVGQTISVSVALMIDGRPLPF
jgi:hypothetical protein